MEQNLNDKTACLVTAFQSGDVSAFSTLYDMHINLLFNYGCKLTTDKELLKDCIHDVFVKLYTKKAELGIIDNFKSYLLISLKNKLCDELRRRMFMSETAVEELNPVAAGDDVEHQYLEKEKSCFENIKVKHLLAQLSPRQREALTLYYIEEKKYEDICTIMDMNYQSQPSLTNAIRELEKEMNITIFNRTNKGVAVSTEVEQFLGYARQVLEQANLLESAYKTSVRDKQRFSVSTQHYAFVVNAFVDLIKELPQNEYDFSIRETQTYEIIDDVATMKSEIGIIYLNAFNEAALTKIIKSKGLCFNELFVAKPHIFVTAEHPLANKESVTMEELADYPYLSFEQGNHNSFYYSEEIFSTVERKKNIRVTDRATLFNLLIGLNGYTVCSGVIDSGLNGSNIISIPLIKEGDMRIGYISHKKLVLSPLCKKFLNHLNKYIK